MKLPRRMALVIGALTALLALFAWRAAGRVDLLLLLVFGALLLILAGLVRPRDQAGRTRIVLACGVHAAAMLLGLLLAVLVKVDNLVVAALGVLLVASMAATARAAYQAPRRRERIYARYLKSSSAEPS